jgi:serine/threonine-protein kinase
MSPEQIRAPQSLDHRTDVYSVGCVVYEMLTGRPPFIASDLQRGDSDFAVRAAHVNGDVVAPRRREPSIPVAVEAVIMKALAKAPDERLPGCAEFARQFVAAAEGRCNDAGLGARPDRAAQIIAGLVVLTAAALGSLFLFGH